MEVSGQLNIPVTSVLGKEHPVSSGQDVGWAPETVWMWWWREKISAPCQKSNCGHPAHRL